MLRVNNIFESYPLRRLTTNAELEITRIKEYIFVTSLLHYDVDWKVTLADKDFTEVALAIPRSPTLISGAASKLSTIAMEISKMEVRSRQHFLDSDKIINYFDMVLFTACLYT